MITFDGALRAHADGANAGRAAIIDGAVRLSYAELDAHINDAVQRLAGHGVGDGDRVMMVADNSWRYLVSAFAVWRANATLVTVYSSSRPIEIGAAAKATSPKLVIASPRTLEAVRSAVGEAVPVWDMESTSAPAATTEAARRSHRGAEAAADTSPALVCYTSGSTAQPKAVMHTSASLYRAAAAYQRLWHLGADDVILVPLPMAWAYGLVTTSMSMLIGGGTVVVLARGNPSEMLSAMSTHRVTVFAGVTTMFVKLVEALQTVDQPRADIASLRFCVSAGEPRNEPVFEQWREHTGVAVHDLWASSECFPVATYDPSLEPAPRPGSAGRVVEGAQLRVVDSDGCDVKPGEVGEAWTRGPALMTGYWADPERTAKALEEGWFHTGDLVHVDREGYVYVVGRSTDVIIRGGSNVSPAEVEAVLCAHPQVREAVVIGMPDSRYGERVVAVLVAAPEAPTDDELTAYCREHLASYKVPSEFVFTDRLPHHPSTGKVSRRDVAALLGAE
jgi:long-chain acyl-CoA synthetase